MMGLRLSNPRGNTLPALSSAYLGNSGNIGRICSPPSATYHPNAVSKNVCNSVTLAEKFSSL